MFHLYMTIFSKSQMDILEVENMRDSFKFGGFLPIFGEFLGNSITCQI